MNRPDFYKRQSDLESRILNAAYHAGRRGRFAKAWNKLWSRTVDQLQALIDERDEARFRPSRDDVMRHVRQTAEYQRYGAWGVFGRSK